MTEDEDEDEEDCGWASGVGSRRWDRGPATEWRRVLRLAMPCAAATAARAEEEEVAGPPNEEVKEGMRVWPAYEGSG